jgi:hypothetical protein
LFKAIHGISLIGIAGLTQVDILNRATKITSSIRESVR